MMMMKPMLEFANSQSADRPVQIAQSDQHHCCLLLLKDSIYRICSI